MKHCEGGVENYEEGVKHCEGWGVKHLCGSKKSEKSSGRVAVAATSVVRESYLDGWPNAAQSVTWARYGSIATASR